MIHYHGTPIGGTRQGAATFLMARHALVPFFYPEDMPIVAEACQSFVLDNSAFTVWTKKLELDIPGFKKWVREWCLHPGFDWALIPDVIDGTAEDNDTLISDWIDSGLSRYGVPVWHMHEPVERLSRLCDEWPTVALGSSGQWPTPGTESWWGRMGEAMDVICDDGGRPKAKLHGLRMLNTAVFNKLPLSSADSTNAAVNSGSLSRYGHYPPPTAGQRCTVIANRIESVNSSPIWQRYNPQIELTFDLP